MKNRLNTSMIKLIALCVLFVFAVIEYAIGSSTRGGRFFLGICVLTIGYYIYQTLHKEFGVNITKDGISINGKTRPQLISEIDEAMDRLVNLMGMKYNSLPKSAIDRYADLEQRYDGHQYTEKLLEDLIDMCERVEQYSGPASDRTGHTQGAAQTSKAKTTRAYNTNPVIKIISQYSFFTDCNNLEEVKKKYHTLSRIYHPDNVRTGNEEIFMTLDAQYTELSKRIV